MKARGSRALLAEARRHLLRFGAVLALTVVSTLLYAGTAWAETFTVTNTSDTGTGSLREAINKANSTAGADEIVFADGVSGTITLASTLPTIMDSAGLVIDGGGDVTVSGNHAVRVFKVGSEAKLTLRNLTIADGEVRGTNFVEGGSGIYNEGTLTLTNGTISGNGGVPFFGSGVYNGWDGTATLRNTIVANSTLGPNCYGSIIDGGYNIEDADTCRFKRATGSLPKTDPLLDPAGLSDNGGPTQTIALQPDSPAVDLVGQSACPPPQTDQRGVMRPQGETCDSGAFELVQEPQSKADCKKGGYKEFGFKSQGKCIAFVNRAARNQ
jgi:hypothetical protein